MSRERIGYRETLEDILSFSEGRRLLSQAEVRAYTGLKDNRSVRARYPIQKGYIAATTLAMCLSADTRK